MSDVSAIGKVDLIAALDEIEGCLSQCADSLSGDSQALEAFYSGVSSMCAERTECLWGDCGCPPGVCSAHKCVRPEVGR